jgi:DNA repair protein RecO (recombination protein O)
VLRRRDSGESDRRLTLLTLEQGKLDAVAKGARKAASRLAGSSDPLTVAQMTLATGKKNRFVTQVQPLASFRGLRTDFERLSFALALAELYSALMPYEQPFPEAYELLLASLQAIERHDRPVVALVWAELKLLDIAGFLPQFDICAITGDPVGETQAWLSPTAGGYIRDSHAPTFADRTRAPAEVLYGLARTAELDQPPPNLKLVEDCLVALLPFWRHVAETALPANEACVRELKHFGPASV